MLAYEIVPLLSEGQDIKLFIDLLHVTDKKGLKFLKNSSCGGAGEGEDRYISVDSRPVKMKLHAASGLGTQKILIKNFRLRLHLLPLAKI